MSEIICYCSGERYIHFLGSKDCLREICFSPIELKNNKWFINNKETVNEEIKNKYDFRQHKNGIWSKLKKIN